MGKVKNKLPKRAQEVLDYGPLIKVCLIQRLTTKDCILLFKKNKIPMTETKWYELKKLYNEGTNARFLAIAKHEWADEQVLIIDKFKDIEAKYWQLFNECEETRDAKSILDSLRQTQEQISMFYNDTPLMSKMKETLEAKLEELNKAANVKKVKK